MSSANTNNETAPQPRLGLTAAQQGIWLGQQLDVASARYNAAECIELRGPVEVERLAHAIEQALAEAQVLSVRIVSGLSGPEQELASAPPRVQRIELAAEGDALARALAWMRADITRPIDLTVGPLYRQALLAAGERVFWYHGAHHIALDGFGFAMLARRAAELYSAHGENKLAQSQFGSLSAVIAEDVAYRASAKHEADRSFWRARLEGMPAPVSLSARADFASDSSLRESRILSADVLARLNAVASSKRGTWGDALIAALAIYLQRATGARELVLGLPVMGRLGSVALRVPCMAMNIVPLRVQLDAGDDFGSVLQRVSAELRALRPHARYRYEQLRRDLSLVGGERRLFGPVINLMPFDLDLRFGSHAAVLHNVSAGPVEDLSVGVHALPGGQGLRIDFDANPACYCSAELAAHAEQFISLIEACVDAPDARVSTAPVMAREPVLVGEPLQCSAVDVIDALEAQFAFAPGAIALESGGERLSYGDLVGRARAVGAALQQRGVQRESLIAIMLPRGIDAIVAILGVLMAGAAYVPLDPTGPAARASAILSDASPLLVITTRGIELPPGLQTLLMEECRDREVTLERGVHGELAYVIYTSGSTGKPNGVMVERAALAHFIAAARQRYGIEPGERILQFAPLHFDASVEEIFLSLCSGGTLVLRSEEMLQSIPHLLRACAELQISVLDLPTAFWHELAYCISTGGGRLPESVRTVIIGGEAALVDRVQRFRRAAAPTTRLFNTYGPTEATVVATTAQLSGVGALDVREDAPIGTPLPGTSAVIVDASLRPVARGAIGELCLLGPALGRGYLGRAQLERERYLTLSEMAGTPRAYRTGDLVRRREDGVLVFVGRVDDELKISGFRVDVTEVENVLLQHPQVREACVVVQTAGSSKRLLAYVVTQEPVPDAQTLRRHAQTSLLAAAVPSSFVRLRELPRTRSGKLDRAALRAQAAALFESPSEAPEGELERAVWNVWRDVLGSDGLSVHEDFFERGGQSLQTIQLANRLSALLQREVPVAWVFRYPTVSQLATALAGHTELASTSLPETLLSDAVLSPELVVPSGESARGRAARQVLLTGATGFVGVHLLQQLLAQTSARVVCLVRAQTQADAQQRLHAAFRTHGLDSAQLAQRVLVWPADLSLPGLGLSEPQFAALAAETDVIYHNAATVSLNRGYSSLRGSNVEATRELIRLACSRHKKALHYVSTLAVAPGLELADEVPETFVPVHQGLRDGYTQSKWVSERLLEQARERGLEVAIYRLGRVVGPLSTGFVNGDDIVWRLLRAGLPAQALPELEVSETWTPVDYLAQAIVALSIEEQTGQPVFHLTAEADLSLRDVFSWAGAYGYRVRSLSMPAFRALLKDSTDAESAATLAFFELQDRPGERKAVGLGRVRSEATRAALQQLGLACPTIDRDVMYRYLDFCVRTGLLPAPAAINSSGDRP